MIWTVGHSDAMACQGGKFDKASYMVGKVMRVPMAFCCPAKVRKGQVTDVLVSNLDISEFYDMALNPYESRNLINSEVHQPLIQEMDGKLKEWVKIEGDNFFDGDSQYILDEFLKRGTSKPRDYGGLLLEILHT